MGMAAVQPWRYAMYDTLRRSEYARRLSTTGFREEWKGQYVFPSFEGPFPSRADPDLGRRTAPKSISKSGFSVPGPGVSAARAVGLALHYHADRLVLKLNRLRRGSLSSGEKMRCSCRLVADIRSSNPTRTENSLCGQESANANVEDAKA
jgi:hypothetical protein